LQIKENRRKEWEKVNNFLKGRVDQIIEAITFNTEVNLYTNDAANLAKNKSHSIFIKSRKEYDEKVNLVDLKTIKNRYLFSASWHGELNNIIICTYLAKQDFQSCSLVILWSILSPLRPKIILNCEERISTISCCTLKNYSNIIIGGCLDGKIIVWEIDQHWLIEEGNKNGDSLL
jgi:hypothetical protein